ncbi:hypothetical protein PENTCL1PPCAC_16763, partial [Pristionchus entomophagus]
MVYLIKAGNRGVGDYRYLLLTLSTQDIIFTMQHILTYPVAESYANSFLLRGRAWFDSHFAISLFFAVLGISPSLIMGNFCYRLQLLTGFKLFFITLALYSSLLLYTALTFLLWFYVTYFVCSLDDETRMVLGPIFNGSIHSPVLHVPEDAEKYIIALYWVCQPIFFEIYKIFARWAAIGGISALICHLVFNYCVMIFCSFSIMRLLESHTSISTSTLNMQRQLLRSLVGQMLFPLFTIYAFVMITLIPPMLGIFPIEIVAIINPNLCGLHPLADGLVLFISVSEYRWSSTHVSQ